MTDELSPRARGIVDAARGADDPTEADRKRVRAAVMSAIAAGAATTVASAGSASAAAGSAPAASTAAAAVPLAVKAMAVTFAIAAVGVGAYLVSRDAPPREPPRADRASDAPPIDRPATHVDDPDPPPRPPTDTDPTEEVMELPPDHVTSHPRQRPSEISAERELLATARAAHRSGRPGDALSHLDDYARRFSGGKLLEERSALRVLVLCDLGKVELARREANAFLRRWPGSIYDARIRGSCGGDTPADR